MPAPWGAASLSCAPAAHEPSHPQLPFSPQSPEAAPVSTRRDWPPGSATRGFGGTAGGDEALGTAMANGGKTRGEKRLQTPCALFQSCPPRLTCGAAGSGLGSAVLMLRPPRVRVRVRVLPRPRPLRRRPELQLQLQWRRRPSAASPSGDSWRSARPPPSANSWPCSRDR